MKLPRRLAMSQVGLVDKHTLHQPCVQSLLFKSRLCVMDASSLGSVYEIGACKFSLVKFQHTCHIYSEFW